MVVMWMDVIFRDQSCCASFDGTVAQLGQHHVGRFASVCFRSQAHIQPRNKVQMDSGLWIKDILQPKLPATSSNLMSGSTRRRQRSSLRNAEFNFRYLYNLKKSSSPAESRRCERQSIFDQYESYWILMLGSDRPGKTDWVHFRSKQRVQKHHKAQWDMSLAITRLKQQREVAEGERKQAERKTERKRERERERQKEREREKER